MLCYNRARGAIGSALALQARGSGIETHRVHKYFICNIAQYYKQ